ncbi:conserved oligomeric Golgi complex subunit 2-like isoform X1 [Phragmites australis]|uniref:conserved oligomeric Golgi complex subunit 2-like isoform X1 n=1 Tax=Phragmites australis TaxID=29695 RepID=UPI002D770202|nr:conserved oligomeric Golgi complex subunit 2-like isoform X1 [Phragmites australis]
MADLAVAPPQPAPAPATDLFGEPIEAHPPWFKPDSFLRVDFDPDAYVAELRTYVPLESLAAELRAHLAALRAELVGLINRDYADFVGLSARLKGVDAAAARMRAPLAELRDKVAGFRAAAAAALAALRAGLEQRAAATAARELLELLLDTSHVVSKVEKLIKELPTAPSDSSNVEVHLVDKGYPSNDPGAPNAEAGTGVRETQSILLERIASEMNRLKFYISHAQNLPFIVNMDKRVQGATKLLDGSLERCFVDGLEHRDARVIYNCLRAYAAIDNTSSAEDLFRITVVSPLIQKIVPQNYAKAVAGVSSDELEDDYQKIKQCVEKDCKFILEISSSANSGLHVFDFLANSILKEVLSAIQKGKPGAFSPGKPKEFLKNYKASLGFLDFLEGYCSSKSAVTKFRSEPAYTDFIRQWNVGVYFSLRFQEIAGGLDSALTATISPVGMQENQGKPKALLLKQSIKLLESLQSCWSDEVLVFSHSDKFLRLSLQLISRYTTWLSSGLSAHKDSDGSSSSLADAEWALPVPAEDFIYIMHDVHAVIGELSESGNIIGHVNQLLASCPIEVLNLVKQSILQAVEPLKELLPAIMNVMIGVILKRSNEDLKHLKGITATYRMTNKLPARHSPYVSGILHPLKVFLDGERIHYLSEDDKTKLRHGSTDKITAIYYDLVSEVVNVARKTESSLQRLRQGAQRRVGASTDASDNAISDTDKICMQLFLDIQEYARNLRAIGIDAREIDSYRALWQCVAPKDKQENIQF